jgi:hypothetical protein
MKRRQTAGQADIQRRLANEPPMVHCWQSQPPRGARGRAPLRESPRPGLA